MANTNALKNFPYKIDVPGMEVRIEKFTDVDSLMRFAKNLSCLTLDGVITMPLSLKCIIHKKLESLIEGKYKND